MLHRSGQCLTWVRHEQVDVTARGMNSCRQMYRRLESCSARHACAAECLCEVDEWVWRNLNCGASLMTNSSKPAATLMPHVRRTRLRFLLSKRWEKIHSGDRGKKKKKGQGETTWPCRCWRFLWQLCDFISRVKVPGEANPLYSCTCQKDFTCWPRDRECRLGSHVSFLSCCLLSPGPKQWLWETVGALMCLCWGHQWCHQLHCHVYMTHWVPDTHRRLLSCFSWLLTRGVMLACF